MVAVGIPLMGAGLLATLVLTTLRRWRRRQEQHRPVGRRIPDPVMPQVETQARVVAQPVVVERLDHALRVLLDWHLFRRLRSRGESRGPAGVTELRQALTLLRGAPLAGVDIAYSAAARNPYVWLPSSDIQPYHLASAIVDTAHLLVGLCLDGADVAGARWAVDQAWLADPDRASDIAWRDLLRVAAAEGNNAEMDQLLGELLQARDAEVPEDLDRETYRLLCELLPDRMRAGVR
jgi:hypothetical protein